MKMDSSSSLQIEEEQVFAIQCVLSHSLCGTDEIGPVIPFQRRRARHMPGLKHPLPKWVQVGVGSTVSPTMPEPFYDLLLHPQS